MSMQLRNVRDWDEEEKKMNEREKRKISFLALLYVLLSKERGEREKEDLNQHPSFFINAEIEMKA